MKVLWKVVVLTCFRKECVRGYLGGEEQVELRLGFLKSTFSHFCKHVHDRVTSRISVGIFHVDGRRSCVKENDVAFAKHITMISNIFESLM